MKQVRVRGVLNVLMCGVLVLGMGGCRLFNGGDDTAAMAEGDMLDPMAVGEDVMALGPRGEFGQPVTEIAFESVAFPFDSFQIADSERPKIEAVADYMLGNPAVTAVVDGHCDERGSREYNLSLGEHRALAVRAYLISLGVAGDRIQTRSFGEEQPVAMGHNESAWRQNRRGEFSLYR